MSCEEAEAEVKNYDNKIMELIQTAENPDDDNDVNVLMALSFYNNRRFTVIANAECFPPSVVENAQEGIK